MEVVVSENLLEVNGLITSFQTDAGWVRAVDGVSFSIPKGKTVGLVGESGCGKTVTAMSIVQLLPKPAGNVLEGTIMFKGEDLRKVSKKRIHEVRGGEIGVIFQEPMSALNPVHRVGRQIAEGLRLHKKLSAKDALQEAVRLLEKETLLGFDTETRPSFRAGQSYLPSVLQLAAPTIPHFTTIGCSNPFLLYIYTSLWKHLN